MDFLHDILLIMTTLGLGWLITYSKRKGRNAADKSDNRDLSYEKTKGEHDAIEEDQVQLTHKERLIRILYLAEKINQSINKFNLYFYDNTNRSRFDQLVEDLNALLTDLYHEQRLANLFLPEDQQKILDDLLTNASGLATELSVNSTNAATYISEYIENMELSRVEKEQKLYYWTSAQESVKHLRELGKKPLEFKTKDQESIKSYAVWLGGYIKQDIKTIDYKLDEA